MTMPRSVACGTCVLKQHDTLPRNAVCILASICGETACRIQLTVRIAEFSIWRLTLLANFDRTVTANLGTGDGEKVHKLGKVVQVHITIKSRVKFPAKLPHELPRTAETKNQLT